MECTNSTIADPSMKWFKESEVFHLFTAKYCVKMQGTSDARILWSRFPSRYYFAHVFKFNKQHFLQANNKKAGTLYILTSNDLPLQCSTERRIWIHVPPPPKKFSWRTSTSWTYKTGHRVIDLFIWYNYFSTGPEV